MKLTQYYNFKASLFATAVIHGVLEKYDSKLPPKPFFLSNLRVFLLWLLYNNISFGVDQIYRKMMLNRPLVTKRSKLMKASDARCS